MVLGDGRDVVEIDKQYTQYYISSSVCISIIISKRASRIELDDDKYI
jgi:hypothetical protein